MRSRYADAGTCEEAMSKVKMTVGGAMEKEAARRFIDAWRRAESGEIFHERHLAFESWDALGSPKGQNDESSRKDAKQSGRMAD
jgi:hypothetical protein